MKKLFLIVIIVCTFGVLHAQETAPATDKAALIAHLETAAGFVIGGAAASVAGFGLGSLGLVNAFVLDPRIIPDALPLLWEGAIAVAGGYTSLSVGYGVFLNTYKAEHSLEGRNMVPYLILTVSGLVVNQFSILLLVAGSSANPLDGRRSPAVGQLIGMGSGLLLQIAGIVVAVAHTQELLAKAKAADSATVSQDRPQPADRIIVTPEIGIGYLGVAISMP